MFPTVNDVIDGGNGLLFVSKSDHQEELLPAWNEEKKDDKINVFVFVK